MLTARAADGVAIDDQRVQQHLGMAAVRFGAVGLLSSVVNQRAVAVRPPGQAFAAFSDGGVVAHALFLAPACDMPR